jgi:hypothetical protein
MRLLGFAGPYRTGLWCIIVTGLKFMSVVEQFLLKTEEIDEEFRLWITSEPNNRFPIGLLQVVTIPRASLEQLAGLSMASVCSAVNPAFTASMLSAIVYR